MKASITIYAVVRIDFTYDNEREVEDIYEVAYGLAVNPNYHSIDEGVQLSDVECCGYQENEQN